MLQNIVRGDQEILVERRREHIGQTSRLRRAKLVSVQ
jgi:hypothetical protein